MFDPLPLFNYALDMLPNLAEEAIIATVASLAAQKISQVLKKLTGNKKTELRDVRVAQKAGSY